jgi:hypothetical protein
MGCLSPAAKEPREVLVVGARLPLEPTLNQPGLLVRIVSPAATRLERTRSGSADTKATRPRRSPSTPTSRSSNERSTAPRLPARSLGRYQPPDALLAFLAFLGSL